MNKVLFPFKPARNRNPDVAVVAPFSFNGNYANTGPRLQAVANRVGVTVVGLQAIGTPGRKRIFDLGMRRALKPGHSFEATSFEAAYDLAEHLEELGSSHDKLVGWGDSRAGINIVGMQLTTKPFGRVLLRDAFNLNAPQLPGEAHLYFADYQIRDGMHTRKARKSPGYHSQLPLPQIPDNPDAPTGNVLSLVGEVCNYSPLMRGAESRQGPLKLAADPELPLHIVGLTHGLSGSYDQFVAYEEELEQARNKAIGRLAETAVGAALRVTVVEDGWHSELMNPDLAAEHVRATLELGSFAS